jgi:hypothetical protein
MKIPSDMLEHLKQMATAIPLEKEFQWKLPASTPIVIPASITGKRETDGTFANFWDKRRIATDTNYLLRPLQSG